MVRNIAQAIVFQKHRNTRIVFQLPFLSSTSELTCNHRGSPFISITRIDMQLALGDTLA